MDPPIDSSVFHVAISQYNFDFLLPMMESHSALINTLDPQGISPLIFAIVNSGLTHTMVEYLVEDGHADVNLNGNGHSPLYYAVEKGSKCLVRYLLSQNAVFNEHESLNSELNTQLAKLSFDEAAANRPVQNLLLSTQNESLNSKLNTQLAELSFDEAAVNRLVQNWLPSSQNAKELFGTTLTPATSEKMWGRNLMIKVKTSDATNPKSYCIKEIRAHERKVVSALEKYPDADGFDCVLRATGFYNIENNLMMVMDFYPHDLHNFIYENLADDPVVRRSLMHQIARGLKYIHSCQIIHADIKPQNILIGISNTENGIQWRATICDFGISIFASNYNYINCTQRYCSPEHLSKKLTFASDIFSMALTYWFMWAKKVPFSNETNGLVIMLDIADGIRPEIGPEFPIDIGILINNCWSHDPSLRPGAADVCARLE